MALAWGLQSGPICQLQPKAKALEELSAEGSISQADRCKSGRTDPRLCLGRAPDSGGRKVYSIWNVS